MQVKKEQLKPDEEKWTGSKLGKEYIKRNAGLEKSETGIKISQRNINNLRCTDDTTLMAETEEEFKSLWSKWKRRVKKLA